MCFVMLVRDKGNNKISELRSVSWAKLDAWISAISVLDCSISIVWHFYIY